MTFDLEYATLRLTTGEDHPLCILIEVLPCEIRIYPPRSEHLRNGSFTLSPEVFEVILKLQRLMLRVSIDGKEEKAL